MENVEFDGQEAWQSSGELAEVREAIHASIDRARLEVTRTEVLILALALCHQHVEQLAGVTGRGDGEDQVARARHENAARPRSQTG